MSDHRENEATRRDLLRTVALAATLGAVEPAAAQHVHQAAAGEKATTGKYTLKLFQEGEWKSLGALAEIICPGAVKAGAPEYIDLLCSSNPALGAIWTGGLAWITGKLGKPFHEATPAEQTALLDKIAFRKNSSPELDPGIKFFETARFMVIDGYYTSPLGVAEIGFKGNVGVSEFKVPQEAIDYALKRSPFANG